MPHNLRDDLRELEGEHQQISIMINALRCLAQESEPDVDEIARVTGEMIRYTKTHFENEEAIMRRVGYPQLQAHQQAHQEFSVKAHDLAAPPLAADPQLPMTMLSFLLVWWDTHIHGADRKLQAFLLTRS